MRPEKFWILVVLSLMIAALIFLEIANDRETLKLTYKSGDAQNQLAEMEHQHEVLLRLLQRIANEAKTDPAFAELLAKRGIHAQPAVPGPAGGQPAETAPSGDHPQ